MSVQTPQPITEWLEKLGLGQYAQRFVENEITLSILPDLTDADLKELGVSALGHRRLLLRAIAELDGVGKRTPTHPAAATATFTPEQRDSAERRQVTVMFSDLVGSTALSARMDPEDLREIISAYQKCVAETVRRFGGFVAKYMGDGVLIYFGYPRAHEDDAERAVRAGLALIAAVSELKVASPLQTRVGIATGLVVVGELIGSGEAQERGIVGETPNLAARLQGIAEPNTVVIAESTRRLLGNLFELEDLGAKDLKGISGPVRAWAAVRPSSVESRFEAFRTVMTPLVGREEEVELLMRRWAQAKGGDGCVVLISGEPGIGKSRIAEAMQERLGAELHTRLRFFCSPYHQDSALYPAIAHLERAAGFRREDTPEQRLAKLEAVLVQATNDLSEVAPLIADLLSIPTGERYPALSLTPQKRKEKTLQALVAQAEGLAVRQPVLMIFEDVHWSDPTTRELLDLLIERVPAMRLLVVITFRPEFSPPWVGRPQVTLLTLNRLPPRQRIEMISRMIGGKALPREIADQIVERTDGVPLFIEELTKTVIESGVVTDAGDRYTVTGAVPSLAIPTSLHASLLARLDRLAPTREIAQIGATLGRSFSHELITAVAGLPAQLLDDALTQLVHAELLYRRGTPPDAEYTFKHALVQDAAYSTLLRNRRQQIHAQVAAILEDKFAEIAATQPALVAHHCTEAGLTEKAVAYWLRAGQRSVDRLAMIEAETQLRKGLNLLARLPNGTVRDHQELNLQLAYGKAVRATRGPASPIVGETFARARRLCSDSNRAAELIQTLSGEWSYQLNRGDITLSAKLAEELRELASDRDDISLKQAGYRCSTVSSFHLGDFAVAQAVAEHALGLSSAGQAPIMALAYLYRSLFHLGHLAQAEVRYAQAIAQARQRAHILALGTLISIRTMCHFQMRPDPAIMLRRTEELATLASDHGFPFYSTAAAVFRGWSLAALGRTEEGLRLLTASLSNYRSLGTLLNLPFFLGVLSDAYKRVGRPSDGLPYVKEAISQINEFGERWAEPHIYLTRSDLYWELGAVDLAEASLFHSMEVARAQNARLGELKAAVKLSSLWRDQGKRKEARDLLAPVYGWFTEGFDTLDLKEAKVLLDELSS